jgi:hypothetical protein
MAEQQPETIVHGFFRRDWPYVAMLIAAIVGVAFASVMPVATTYYWELLVPCFAAVCIWTRMHDAQHQALLGRLMRIEALHWGAVFVAMRIVTMSDVSQMVNVVATPLLVLTLLALGTFTAGAQIGAWRICVVGAILGISVPFIAWLDRSTLLVTLIALVIGAVAAFVYGHHKGSPRVSSSHLRL